MRAHPARPRPTPSMSPATLAWLTIAVVVGLPLLFAICSTIIAVDLSQRPAPCHPEDTRCLVYRATR